MVYLNKARLQKGVPSQLQMPCQILAKYGSNAYKIDLLDDLALSPIFNVSNLVKYKGPAATDGHNILETIEVVADLPLPPPIKSQAKKVLDSRVKKQTRHGIYMEHLIK